MLLCGLLLCTLEGQNLRSQEQSFFRCYEFGVVQLPIFYVTLPIAALSLPHQLLTLRLDWVASCFLSCLTSDISLCPQKPMREQGQKPARRLKPRICPKNQLSSCVCLPAFLAISRMVGCVSMRSLSPSLQSKRMGTWAIGS